MVHLVAIIGGHIGHDLGHKVGGGLGAHWRLRWVGVGELGGGQGGAAEVKDVEGGQLLRLVESPILMVSSGSRGGGVVLHGGLKAGNGLGKQDGGALGGLGGHGGVSLVAGGATPLV